MQLNEVHNEHEHAPSSTKIALLVFAVILVSALGYLVWANNKQTVSDDSAVAVIKKTPTATATTTSALTPTPTTATSTDIVYTNTDYGFTMTLTSKWKGYKIKTVKPTDGTAVAYLYINVPTTSTDATWIQDSSTNFAYYASVMAISVYTTAEWDTMQASGGPTDTKLAQNSQYVFGYSQAQSIPTDLTAAYKEVATVAATFKLK